MRLVNEEDLARLQQEVQQAIQMVAQTKAIADELRAAMTAKTTEYAARLQRLREHAAEFFATSKEAAIAEQCIAIMEGRDPEPSRSHK
jgi:preprotein translocase subunit SecA